jgi:hypothetical protein
MEFPPPLYDTARNSRFYPKPNFYPTINLPPDCGWHVDFSGPFSNYLQFNYQDSSYLLGLGRAGNLLGFSMPPRPDQEAEITILAVPHTQKPTAFCRDDFPEDRLNKFFRHSAQVAQQRALDSPSGVYFSFEGQTWPE